jgi:hypothetical protein
MQLPEKEGLVSGPEVVSRTAVISCKCFLADGSKHLYVLILCVEVMRGKNKSYLGAPPGFEVVRRENVG